MFQRKHAVRDEPGRETSLIARGTVIRGDVYFAGTLHLDGRVEGSVQATGDDAMLTLGEHGQVDGEIRVPQALINGHVVGDVAIARLTLAPLARIDGDLRYHTLELAAGAQVNGRIARQADEVIPRELPGPSAPACADTSNEAADDAVVA